MAASRVTSFRRLLLGLVLGAFIGAAPAAAEDVVARRYDVRLTILPDGSLDVAETIRMSAGIEPMTRFRRTLAAGGTDGLQLMGVRLDGTALAVDRNGLGVRVRGHRDLDVQVAFAPTVRADRVIEIRYHARQVVAMDEGRPRLRWTALPEAHDYAIERATITVAAPSGVEAREIRATGGAVGVGAEGGLMVTAAPVGRDATVTLDLIFVPGTLVPVDPIWFRDQERARQLVPAFASSFLVLLVIGIGVLAMVVAQDRVRNSADDRRGRLAGGEAGGDSLDPALAPGLASLLVANGRARQWLCVPAACLGLVQRGAMTMTPKPSPRWRRRACLGVQPGASRAAWRHEQWLIDQLPAHGNGVDLARFACALFRRRRAFHACLDADARTLGWIEPERERAVAGLRATGLGLAGAAVLSAVVVAMGLQPLGPAAQLLPAGLLADGILFALAATMMGRLSACGQRAAVAWRARASEMRVAVRARRAGGAGDPERAADVRPWLPFAVGIGLGRAWVKAHAAAFASSDAACVRAFGGVASAPAVWLAMIRASGAARAGRHGVKGAGGGGGGTSRAG